MEPGESFCISKRETRKWVRFDWKMTVYVKLIKHSDTVNVLHHVPSYDKQLSRVRTRSVLDQEQLLQLG